MTTTMIAAPAVETIDAKNATVTFTVTATSYAIRAVDKRREVNGEPAEFTADITLCDCRTNPDSPRLRQNTRDAVCHCSNQWDARSTCACHDNTGRRPLCPQGPRHNAKCHHVKDHCTHGWHPGADTEARVRKILDAVVRSYS